ncbi:hypothetical protein MAH4_15230 [Sessilibacter sp. MAH4]
MNLFVNNSENRHFNNAMVIEINDTFFVCVDAVLFVSIECVDRSSAFMRVSYYNSMRESATAPSN